MIRRPLVFFDVDETLIATKSMFDFLRYRLAAAGDDGTRYSAVCDGLRVLADRGADREVINRRYYATYAGADWSALVDEGLRWYRRYRAGPAPYVSGGIAALNRHRASGHTIVLVSGSFEPCLRPVADHLGADALLCTEVEVDSSGRMTGRALRPMVGSAKGVAARAFMADAGVPPAACFGYGDHASDLAMLAEVGHPAVVGTDPVLLDRARRDYWPRLPAHAVPEPAPIPVPFDQHPR
jgi:HAD superfamily hydrolase (TIGR01490 family)